MALEFLTESPADAAEFKSMQSGEPQPDPAPDPKPDPAPAPAPDPKPSEAPKPAAEPAKPAEAAKPAEPVKPTFVPHAALHEERLKRQAAERELAELRAGRAPAPAAEPTKEIDPDTDPIAALKEVREFQQQQRNQAQQQQQLREFDGRIQAHETDWVAANPDYGDQVSFLREFRAGQLETLGLTKEQIGVQLLHEARQIAWSAFEAGKNPGEVFSSLAVKSGWKGKAPDPAPNPNPAPAPDAAPDVEAKRAESEAALERISRGQKAGRKTAGGGGNEPSPEMTLEQLSGLTGAAFDAAMEKHGKRLFGG